MDSIHRKIDNSYESERSSSNGSIIDLIATETTTIPFNLPDLFAVYDIGNVSIFNNANDKCTNPDLEAIEYDSENTRYSLRSSVTNSTEVSDQNERVLKDLDEFKLTKMLKAFTSSQPSSLQQKSNCDTTVQKSPSTMFNMENSSNALDNKISTQISSTQCTNNLSFPSNIADACGDLNDMPPCLLTDRKLLETKAKEIPLQYYERSPDMFADCLDSEEEENERVVEDRCAASSDLLSMHNTSTFIDWEKQLVKNLQASLSGVLPPPSKTIIQHSITELLALYDDNSKKMLQNKTESLVDTSSIKPSHTVEQIKAMKWEDFPTDAKCHGVYYNRSIHSENIESLGMKYVERCVGVETSSSFTHVCRPSINDSRLKMLSKSPGTRLSHLAKRKKILTSKQCGSDSSKLGRKQLVIDIQKYNKRKRKVATPKRQTPAKKRTPGRTPTSAHKRKDVWCASKPTIATRESSRRALFQSPPQQKPKPSIPVDVARRVDKSRRMLFSPQSEHSTINQESNLGKRRRDEDGLLGNLSKIPRCESVISGNTTPRSLLAKSQTFGGVTKTTNDVHVNGPTVHRSRSEATLHGSQQLSQSHRRKLLWAVSTSLGKKNINSKHQNFTAYATILAKLVKRLFFETRNESASTSDTMIRIADRLVFWVIQGKTVEEIYLNEKNRKENRKASQQPKLSGYIAPEDYEKLKNPLPKISSCFSLTSMDSFGFSQTSFNFSMQSQSSNMSGSTDISINDASISSNCFGESQVNNSNSDKSSNPLCNSSSKSNSGNALRENIRDNEVRSKSGQKLIEFSGRNQKNVSPYHETKFSGRTNIMSVNAVKRQITFDA